MRYRIKAVLWLLAIVATVMLFGCGGSGDPVAPPNPQTATAGAVNSANAGSESNRVLWGLYEITIDPETSSAEVVPVRQADFTINVTAFLQPNWAATNLVSLYLDPVDSDFPNGLVVCDVTLQHPFPGFSYYRGFDVRGIVMGHDTQALQHDTSARFSGPGDLTLLNPDGYTRWWNPSEFGPHGTLFGYIQGRLAPKNYVPAATLNGYKYFSNELGADEPVVLDPENRGTFSNNPGVNTRRYELQFPMAGGMPVYRFGYAVDASWSEPDQAKAPGYDISSFPPDANCAEAYLLSLNDTGSTAWYASESDKGGVLNLAIEVFDWQAQHNPQGVIGELAGLWLEGEIVSEPIDLLTDAIVVPGGPTSSVFEIEIINLDLNHAGPNEVWIVAESADPATYEPQIDENTSSWSWPNAPLAAYLRTSVDIAGIHPQDAPIVSDVDPDEGVVGYTLDITVTGQSFAEGCQVELRESGKSIPMIIQGTDEVRTDDTEVVCTIDLMGATEGLYDVAVINPGLVEGVLPEGFEVLETGVIYVDDSNENSFEDGTMGYPYDSIQEAIDAAGLGYEVWVDDSGEPYLGQIIMADGIPLRSVNWDDSDGGDRATITVTNGTETVLFAAADATLEGFEINGTHDVWNAKCGIDIDGVSPDIIDCHVTEFHLDDARGIWLHNGSFAHLDYVEVSQVSNNTYPGYSQFHGILIEDCDAIGDEHVIIEHTVVHDVFSTGLYDGLNCDPHGILINTSDGVQVINSIVHNVTGGSGHDVVGIEVMNSADVELTNDVIYFVDKTYYYGNALGISFFGCTDLDVRNTVIFFVRKNWPLQFAYGVRGSSSTYTFEYNDVYECTSSLYYNVTPGTGCISSNPMFLVDGIDFHLKNGSPCIDTGDPDIVDTDDSISDMGAYGGPGGDW